MERDLTQRRGWEKAIERPTYKHGKMKPEIFYFCNKQLHTTADNILETHDVWDLGYYILDCFTVVCVFSCV